MASHWEYFRRNGTTTRLALKVLLLVSENAGNQRLWVEVKDHYPTRDASKVLLQKVQDAAHVVGMPLETMEMRGTFWVRLGEDRYDVGGESR